MLELTLAGSDADIFYRNQKVANMRQTTTPKADAIGHLSFHLSSIDPVGFLNDIQRFKLIQCFCTEIGVILC